MIKPGKAVEEVWRWREEIGEEIKDMSAKERVEYFNKAGLEFAKKYGLKYYDRKKVHV